MTKEKTNALQVFKDQMVSQMKQLDISKEVRKLIKDQAENKAGSLEEALSEARVEINELNLQL